MSQVMIPTACIATGWILFPAGGTALSHIDEGLPPDDTDYIYKAAAIGGTVTSVITFSTAPTNTPTTLTVTGELRSKRGNVNPDSRISAIMEEQRIVEGEPAWVEIGQIKSTVLTNSFVTYTMDGDIESWATYTSIRITATWTNNDPGLADNEYLSNSVIETADAASGVSVVYDPIFFAGD